jgi:hypothetical protein
VGGGIPRKAPFRRAAQYDGVTPVHSQWPTPVEVSHLQNVLDIVIAERGNLDNYDIIICGETTGTDSVKDYEKLAPWINAGITWWLEDIYGLRANINELRERIRAGPPEL